jgi:hypothetical protein
VKSGMNAAVAAGSPVVPTMKPWKNEAFLKRYEEIKCGNIVALAMDIDAAGFANLGTAADSASPKSVAEIREIVDAVDVPFLLKGVMTARGAEKAAEAGCAGIVVQSRRSRLTLGAVHLFGAARDPGRGRAQSSDFVGRRNPERSRRIQSDRARGGRSDDRKALLYRRTRRRRGGHRPICKAYRGAAPQHHADMRRAEPWRDQPRDGQDRNLISGSEKEAAEARAFTRVF